MSDNKIVVRAMNNVVLIDFNGMTSWYDKNELNTMIEYNKKLLEALKMAQKVLDDCIVTTEPENDVIINGDTNLTGGGNLETANVKLTSKSHVFNCPVCGHSATLAEHIEKNNSFLCKECATRFYISFTCACKECGGHTLIYHLRKDNYCVKIICIDCEKEVEV